MLTPFIMFNEIEPRPILTVQGALCHSTIQEKRITSGPMFVIICWSPRVEERTEDVFIETGPDVSFYKCAEYAPCLLSAECADQLSDTAWVTIGDQSGETRSGPETSLVQAVQGRSHRH